jgi:hypothetical protein
MLSLCIQFLIFGIVLIGSRSFSFDPQRSPIQLFCNKVAKIITLDAVHRAKLN